MRKDPFKLHKLALAPFLESEQPVYFHYLLAEAEKEDSNDFLQFLIFNGLAALWHEKISIAGQEQNIHPEFFEKLQQVRLTSEANYLMQKKTLQKIHETLTTASIEYVIFKGAQIRELIYEKPSLRPCTDIDVLVSKQNRNAAIHALSSAGMMYRTTNKFSHEAALIDGPVHIDLHSYVTNPSRMRIDISESILRKSQNMKYFLGPSNEETLFILLVHPAFRKHVCNPYALLIRTVDLLQFLKTQQVNWDSVIQHLNITGIKTAAWATMYWIRLLTNNEILDEYMNRLKPNTIQRKYLELWIRNNLPTNLVNHRIIVWLMFSLALHDNVTDALRFLYHGKSTS